MDSPSGSNGSTTPIQPRRRPRAWIVTKTPRFSANTPLGGRLPTGFWREMASAIARRASSSRDRRSSERNGILGLFVALHHTQLAALLDTVVQLTPKLQEILRRRHQCADHYKPQKEQAQAVQQGVLLLSRSGDQNCYRAHLQNHFRFA